MPTPAASEIVLALWAVGLTVVSSCCALALLRYARFPDSGRAVLAGALAGFVIGPTILGRAVPQQHEAIFEGGVKQREHRDYLRWLGAELPVALPKLSPEARAAEMARGAADLAVAEQALARARWSHQQPMRVFAMCVVALAMLASASRSVQPGDARQGLITPASIGAWSMALSGAAACIIAVRWWNVNIGQAALLAAAVSIGPWALSAIDRRVADEAEIGGARMMQTAGRIASSLAIALTLWAAWRTASWAGAALVTPLLAPPIAWLFDLRNVSRAVSLEWLVEGLLAILAALVTIKFDLYQHFAFWPLIVLALVADDGRWLGAFIGAMLVGGRPALRTMRLVMPAMACGPTQLAVAAVALHGWLLPARFAMPLLAGAILIEVSAPARRRMAARLIKSETDLEQVDGQ